MADKTFKWQFGEDIVLHFHDNGDGTWSPTVYSAGGTLPTGAATAARQDTMITALQLIDDLRGALNSVGTDELDVVLEATEVHIGNVGAEGTTITVSPTVTAGAYVANDVVGEQMEFANAARVAAGGGVIKDLLIIDDAGQDVEMELWLFDQAFTVIADNAPWAPSEADLRNLVAVISTADGAWLAAGTPSVARIEASQRFDCAATSLFGQLVTRGAPTFAAIDDVSMSLGLLQD